jgi:hypothetical protein
MAASQDPALSCETQLKSLGLELLDLGRDFESQAHLYYIFDTSSGALLSERILLLEDVQRFIDALK